MHKGPASRTDDFEQALFNKLEQVTALALKVGAAAVCIAGDLFHHKTRVPYATISKLLMWARRLQAAGIPVLVIAGNHDLQHDRLDSLPTQPLGVLLAAGAMIDVSYRPQWFDGVRVVGVPYPDAKDITAFARLLDNDRSPGILMAHCFATVEGGTYFGEHIHRYADFAALPYAVIHLGHDHTDHGVVQLGHQYFVNLGALSRGSLAEDEIMRAVKIALVTFEPTTPEGDTPVTVQQVKLKVAPAAEVFDLVLHAERQKERREIETFVTDLTSSLAETGPLDFYERLNTMELPDEVRRRVTAYIEAEEHHG